MLSKSDDVVESRSSVVVLFDRRAVGTERTSVDADTTTARAKRRNPFAIWLTVHPVDTRLKESYNLVGLVHGSDLEMKVFCAVSKRKVVNDLNTVSFTTSLC